VIFLKSSACRQDYLDGLPSLKRPRPVAGHREAAAIFIRAHCGTAALSWVRGRTPSGSSHGDLLLGIHVRAGRQIDPVFPTPLRCSQPRRTPHGMPMGEPCAAQATDPAGGAGTPTVTSSSPPPSFIAAHSASSGLPCPCLYFKFSVNKHIL